MLFKFRCNIFIGVRIIKETPGSVVSGTLCIYNDNAERDPTLGSPPAIHSQFTIPFLATPIQQYNLQLLKEEEFLNNVANFREYSKVTEQV